MEIKVIAQYTDKNNGSIHRPGEVLEVSDDRGRELIGKGKAEQIFHKEEKKAPVTKEMKTRIKTKAKTKN